MTPSLAQRTRSDRAFERMYRRYVGDVYRYALAVMRNPADAEDVTQTTFMNAYRAYAEKGDRPEKPQNWLIAIAHNVCRQRFRQSARRPSEVSFEDDIADAVVDDETPSGEDIRRALSHLAFNQRAALVIGGAGYEGVHQVTANEKKPAAVSAPAVKTVRPAHKAAAWKSHGQVVRTGKSKAHAHAVAGHGQRQKQAKAHQTHKAHASGRSAHNKHYLRDGSVAARHVKVAQPPGRS